jgi:hypothetical protein
VGGCEKSGEKTMFFVRGLSSKGKDVFVNPDQVLYVCPAGLLSKKTALVLTHRQRLVVDQDAETVRLRFEDYLKDVVKADDSVHHGREHTHSGERSHLS